MKKFKNIKRKVFALIICLTFSLCACVSTKPGTEIRSTLPAETQPIETTADTQPEEDQDEEPVENTFEHNEYYDVVDAGKYEDIGKTYIIYKILAKQDVSMTSTLILHDKDGAVIGMDRDDIILTEGQFNFFCYRLDNYPDDATWDMEVNVTNNYLSGDRNAVEMIDYNKTDTTLYFTFEQTADKVGSFAKYKLLFYKDDQIVGSQHGYFTSERASLTGNGATFVKPIWWSYGLDFDRVEYFFEP